MKNIGLVLIVVIFSVFGCKSPKEAVAELQSGKYDIVSINGEEIDDKAQVDINFNTEASRVTGSAGCNKYTASYTVENGMLEVKQAAVTKMSCMFMSIETQFLKAMSQVKSYKYKEDMILLLDENKNVILKGKK